MQLIGLNTRFLGRNCIFYKEIDSTQSEIWRLYKDKTTNGTLVMSDIQTRGKGTHGRIWYTDEIDNVAFSFLIITDCNISKIEGLTIQIAEIIIHILKEKYNISLNIKKPNDIVWNSKKIGGILTESKISGERLKALVIGIGINTNGINFAKEIEQIATSIKKEFKIEINRDEFITEFCNRFEELIIEKGIAGD